MQDDMRYVGPQPRYHPDVVARSILYASTHNVRDLPSGTQSLETSNEKKEHRHILRCGWSAFLQGYLTTCLYRY